MAICRWLLRCWCVILLLALLVGRGNAATLVNLQWNPDDAGIPPADHLTLHVLLMPGEQSARIQARAALVLGEECEFVEPVLRRAGADGISGRDYVADLFVYRPGDSDRDSAVLVVERVAILHADLQLPDGPCRLAYEIRVAGADGTTYVQPTPLLDVLVTDRGRQTLNAALAPQAMPPAAPPAAALSSLEPPGRRLIYYATNRKIIKSDARSLARFGDELSGQLSFGRSQVNIPVASHRVGDLEGPICNWWGRKAGEHFCVEWLDDSPRQAFARQLPANDVLLFVHGFNNSLEDALLRTAQLRHDVEFPGPAVSFSWPSAGSVLAYRDDEKQVAPSVAALTDLLETLLTPRTGTSTDRKLHVLAHSMGNRLLLEAVTALAARQPQQQYKLGYVVVAAADVDEKAFRDSLPNLLNMAQRVTYYYSAEDVALKAGQRLYGSKPVGLAPWFAPALDTINADDANSAWVGWGHRYYAGSDRVLLDMNLLVNRRLEPQRRQPPLRADAQTTDRRHWLFAKPD
ncbi:MAG: alpha/beta hydrolase [Planctomycetes bacterium]|nr:alpha/beta hydrolase [Planctomycetota bacterium]